MGRKKKQKLNNLPNDFIPTKRQKERMKKIRNFVIRKCQNCDNYFVSMVSKNQIYCYKCYPKNRGRTLHSGLTH